MTTTPPPYIPGPPAFPPAGPLPPPAKKSRHTLRWILAGAFGLIALCLAGSIIIVVNGGGKPASTPTTARAAKAAAPLPAEPTQAPTTASTPAASDFVLTPTVTSKECFGSAGCNVTFRLKVNYTGPTLLDPGVTWLVVYQITGVDDAPQVGNLTVQGDNINYDEQNVSTKSSKSKITLKATSVEQN